MKKLNVVFLVLVIASTMTPCWAGLRGDIDGNGKVNLTDAVFIMGWINSGKSPDLTVVKSEANSLYTVSTTPARVPDISNDDFDGNGKINLSDVVFLLGWVNSGKSYDATLIQTEAALLYTVSTSLTSYPGLENGSATIPITIDGITSN